jgi:hypothetical protein
VMSAIKTKLKIISTNWINMAVIAVATYLWCIINSFFQMNSVSDLPGTLVRGVVGGAILVLFYGAMFFAGFMIIMLFLDIILLRQNAKYLRVKLISEWILGSSPFVYWTVIYNEWIFAVAIVALGERSYLEKNELCQLLIRRAKSRTICIFDCSE